MSSYTTLSENHKNRFIRFSNTDGKVWIVPIKKMRTALNLYQPSGVKGKLVKLFLPYMYWLPLVRSFIKAESLQIKLDDHIESLLYKILDTNSFEFSIFEGTPSVHKKVTIQISQGDMILAYCKLSSSSDVISLFKHEQKVLATLRAKGVENIPKCLYCDVVSEDSDLTIFVQSTIKTNSSQVVHKWRDEHWQFLDILHNNTKVKVRFTESDFARSLVLLEGYLSSFQVEDRNIISQAMLCVRDFYGEEEVYFSTYHADFTPWNMFFERSELFVFDFEYAGMTYPPYLDWFHYFTQTSYFEKHLSIDEIIIDFRTSKMANNVVVYKAYLLDIISKYINRESGNISNSTMLNIRFWINILVRL